MLSGNVVSAIRGIGSTIEEGEVSYESLYTDSNLSGTLGTVKGAASDTNSALQVSTNSVRSTGTFTSNGALLGGTTITSTEAMLSNGNFTVNPGATKFVVTASTGNLVSRGDILLNDDYPVMNVPGTYSDTPTAAATGVVSVTTFLTNLSTTNDDTDDAWTLADGINGQLKKIVLATHGGDDMVITPSNFHDGSTITMASANGFILLTFLGGAWAMVNNKSATIV
mgnify:CR=1 FL=1